MKRRLIISNERRNHRAWLYSVVYTGRIAVFTVLVLFASFLVQPFHEALAAEEEVVEEEVTVVAESVKEQIDESQEEEVQPEEIEEDLTEEVEDVIEDVDESEVDNPSDETDEIVDITEEEVLEDTEDDGTSTSTEDVVTETEDGEVATSTESTTGSSTDSVVDEETDSEEDIGSGSSLGGSSNDSTETENESDIDESGNEEESNDDSEENNGEEQQIDEDDVSSTASTTVVNGETVVQAETLITEDNFYQFSKQSCVAVGDGTYHCSESDFAQYDTQSVVYSELGPNGNMEVFLKTSDDEVRQITDNEFDDTAPYYDAGTLQVVWQRLIDGRYQIILYDIEEGKESQLTFSRTNNMEPKVSEDGVVWQAWDNNDWEIMYFDGRFTDQITDNTAQDVAPVIQDDYVLWTVIGKGEQEAKVYSLDSQEIVTISGYDGGLIENPRFVLVYDTKFDNGDIITQGFDPTTGISEPIAAKAAPEPVDIPMSDPVGEIRALIQNKSNFEDEFDTDIVKTDGTPNASSTATSSDTLDLSDGSDTEEEIVVDDADDDLFELTEFDLVLTGDEIDFDALEDLEEIDEIIEDATENTEVTSDNVATSSTQQ